MTAIEIIQEIKQLPLGEQEQVASFVREWRSTMTPEQLGVLAGQLAGEDDEARAQALMEKLTRGFYGESSDAKD